MSYNNVPSAASLSLSPFEAKIPDKQISDFRQLLELSPIGPETYENTTKTDGTFGISRKWLTEAKDHWLNKWDWKKCEEHINTYNNYTTSIKGRDGKSYKTHFIALFSDKTDAIPVLLNHGWPGSFLEFLPFLDEAKKKYSSSDLPYHFVVPSSAGYTFSEGPSLQELWANEDMAFMVNELMCGLGFQSGYVAQGGDLGSFMCRIQAKRYDACKAIHLNLSMMAKAPDGADESQVTDAEKKGLERSKQFSTLGSAYAMEHGTRSGTVGLVLSSSPLALLAWIGEKYQEWSDTTPALDDILDSVALYWFTSTFPRAIYPYVELFGMNRGSVEIHRNKEFYCEKPLGYSWFPQELAPMPIAWVKASGNLVWHKSHTSGGHFAALEKPKELLEDVEDFIKVLNLKKANTNTLSKEDFSNGNNRL